MATAAENVPTGQKKLAEITSLMQKLKVDLDSFTMLPFERGKVLERIKILGRSADDAGPLYTKEGIEILCRHGFDSTSLINSRDALRCLANALYLVPETRQTFVDTGYAEKAIKRLKTNNSEDEFIVGRILFLTTYGSNLDFVKLIDQYDLGDAVTQIIIRHAKQFSKKKAAPAANATDDLALAEILKLLFNFTHFCPERTSKFSKAIPYILKILTRRPLQKDVLASPVNAIINALVNLDLEDTKSRAFAANPLFPKADQKINAERLVLILDRALVEYPEDQFDVLGTPLVDLIRRVYNIAPEPVRQLIKKRLLPTEAERNKPLGKSDSMPSRLLQITSSALAIHAREIVSTLLFELSDADPTLFVRNIGYGFASGYLMSHNIAVPENAMEAFSSRPDQSGSSRERLVNPITGQRFDDEANLNLPEMTQAEKEREAERLFVLFERLKKTGVVKVKNPVEQAVEDGRFEDLD